MTAPEPRPPLLPVVHDALAAFGIEASPSGPVAHTGRLVTAAAIYDVLGYADDSTSLVVCSFTFPVRVPEARRAAVGETLHRINTDTPVGAFELDYETGVVRFRTGADMEGIEMLPHSFLMMLSATRHLCDTYHAAIMGVAFGDGAPAEAVAAARAALAAGTPPPAANDNADDDELDDDDDVEPISAEELDAIIRDIKTDVADEHVPDETTVVPPVVRPYANAYVVPGTRLVAGEYPGAARPRSARAKLTACLDAGITVFVDLTHAHELEPYDAMLAELAAARGIEVDHHRLPIRDMDVCEEDHMRSVLDTIDQALGQDRTVYVHCWGGVGRTGTTVGCWLVRHGMDGSAALAQVRQLFGTMSEAKLARHPEGSPQTSAQRRFVTRWASADRV